MVEINKACNIYSTDSIILSLSYFTPDYILKKKKRTI